MKSMGQIKHSSTATVETDSQSDLPTTHLILVTTASVYLATCEIVTSTYVVPPRPSAHSVAEGRCHLKMLEG